MQVSRSKLINFLEEPTNILKKTEKEKAKEYSDEVKCSYLLTWTKIYVILIVWSKYMFDLYITYIRQFSYLNSVVEVPEELKPFYSLPAFEEAKIQYMFRTLINLEARYNQAIHLTVVYLTNVYCTLWWIASRITKNILTRSIVFHFMCSICQYRSGDFFYHINIILSSYSVGEGACRICNWMKDVMKKALKHVATISFLEEVILSVILTIITTPMVVVLFLLYRLYKTFVLPVIVEERLAHLTKLENGELMTMINKLCQKFDFVIQSTYVSQKPADAHIVKVRGFDEKKYLILGFKLVEGHQKNSTIMLYTRGEIAAAILRAQAGYTVTTPTRDIALEATRWVTVIMFAIFLTFGFWGGSRLGFVPSPPQLIAFTISRHLSIPILLVVQMVQNNLYRQKHIALDNKVAEVGFAEHLISYIGKECRFTHRCPVEDPFYTLAYSDRPPIIYRIQNLKTKLEPPSVSTTS